MTIEGLCIFLDIGRQTWFDWRDREGFSHIVTRVENLIWSQKFEGAAADLLNHNIIAREPGLADKSQVESVGRYIISDGAMTEDEWERKYCDDGADNVGEPTDA